MKKMHVYLLLFLFCSFSAWTEESLLSLSQQAEALWEAHDYTAASNLYEQLIPHSLPSWQKNRLLYNVGTIRLAQHDLTEALDFFHKITPLQLSLPRFGRDLFLNQGIAYLQYAQTLHARSPALNQQVLFIEQALQAFKQARLIDCQLQQTEQDQATFSCHPHHLIEQWTQMAHLQLHVNYQQRDRDWMENAPIETLARFLSHGLQDWIQHLNTFQNQVTIIPLDAFFFSYFKHQAEAFLTVWNILQHKTFSLNQKLSFDQAQAFYLHTLEALNQQDFPLALKEMNQATEALALLVFKEESALKQAALDYTLVVFQESPLTVSDVQNLLTQFDDLEVEQNQMLFLEKIKKNLHISLEELQTHHLFSSRFFLLAGFNQMASLLKAKQTTSKGILQQALEQADQALQLFLLRELMEEESSKKSDIQAILKEQQQAILTYAAAFIPTVLDEQKTQFQEAKNPANACQQFPWEQAIPLFDQGLKAAQNAEEQLNKTVLNSQDIITKQKQTIKDWQQALVLLQQPPQQHQNDFSKNETAAAAHPQSLNEIFRLIQDMYLQDQFESQPEKNNQELHSW